MKQVKYGDSSFTLRLEIPNNYDHVNIASVNITITDMSGSDLLAATSATIYDADGVDTASAIAYDDSTITLTGTVTKLYEGDRLYIPETADGPDEIVTVSSYNASSKVVTLRDNVEEAHTSGVTLYGMWATYACDFSTTTTFTKGKQFRVVWEFPDTDDPGITELYEVAAYTAGYSDFWGEYRTRYPVQFEMLGDRDLDSLERIVRDEFKAELLLANINVDRVVDQPLLDQGIVRYARKLILEGSGDMDEFEYQVAMSEWNRWLTSMRDNTVLWTDDDQDGAIEEGEAVIHVPYFGQRSM